MTTTTTIDKLALTQAARLCGNWDQLQLFREDARRRLRSEGRTRQDAMEESWRLAEREFTPTLDNFLFDFRSPPSLITGDEIRVVWRRANSWAMSLAWVLGHYSLPMVNVVTATQARLAVDPTAQEVPPALFNQWLTPQEPMETFADRAIELFAQSARGITGKGRLADATRRELESWQRLLPELPAVAAEFGIRA